MQLFAIFGNPVAHSKSPLMHNSVFTHLKIPACYTRVLLEDGSQLRKTFLKLQLQGANITVPHKEAAYNACDEIRGFAKKVGVVNTIINENGKLIGYNTDADGFMYAIERFYPIKKVLVLGAGGTAKALVQRFLDEQWDVSVLNRSSNRLDFFQAIGAKAMSWEDFSIEQYDLVVNTTSAGLNDDALPAPQKIIKEVLTNTKYVADAIYGKLTPFLQCAKQHNKPFIDGAAMLLGQGVLANELFIQKRYSKEQILPYMQQGLNL
ncbi:MAG: shikimate dehydrogenase [Epsilonproteobacteria bacterium]|nr:shikimate dehydrogenase [Campylobacterota bacterium]